MTWRGQDGAGTAGGGGCRGCDTRRICGPGWAVTPQAFQGGFPLQVLGCAQVRRLPQGGFGEQPLAETPQQSSLAMLWGFTPSLLPPAPPSPTPRPVALAQPSASPCVSPTAGGAGIPQGCGKLRHKRAACPPRIAQEADPGLGFLLLLLLLPSSRFRQRRDSPALPEEPPVLRAPRSRLVPLFLRR